MVSTVREHKIVPAEFGMLYHCVVEIVGGARSWGRMKILTRGGDVDLFDKIAEVIFHNKPGPYIGDPANYIALPRNVQEHPWHAADSGTVYRSTSFSSFGHFPFESNHEWKLANF
jgi:hypothetical protein